jgi:hypothetical protein
MSPCLLPLSSSRGTTKLLQPNQLPIPSSLAHQLIVASAFDYSPSIEDVYHIRVLDSAESVGYCDGSAAFCSAVEGKLDRAFRCGVEGRRRFVQ